MKKFFILVNALVALFIAACDSKSTSKGTDTVDFIYYLDASDRKLVHFVAKGESGYGTFAYKWDFGDGAVGDGTTIAHEYADFGKFTVTMKASISESNIEKTITKDIVVEIPKISDLDFEVTPDKKDYRLFNFKAKGDTDYGNIEYEWDFGDGFTTSGNNVQYGFEYFGVYNITLTGKISEYDKITSVTKRDVNIAAPTITRLEFYEEQDKDNPFLFHFTPIASATWGTIEYEWSFGDGKISIEDEPTNQFQQYSTYRVKVKAKIVETGYEEEYEKEIVVEKPVFKNYEISHTIDQNDPLQVYFTIENTDGSNEEDASQQDTFYWEFGDGETSSGLRVNHRFDSYGEKIIYVVLRTPDQTQKTITKTITLVTPYIDNIKITGTPSYKAGNLIEYRVTADSEFLDEIQYDWEFEDGVTKSGRAVTREMTFWPTAVDAEGNITERIYLRAYIPRLNVSVRNKEPYEIKVQKPKILDLDISCGDPFINDYTCSASKNGKKPKSSTGGDIEYEWEFDGQTFTGANQKFTLASFDKSYLVTLKATIEDTNISSIIQTNLSIDPGGIGFNCSSDDERNIRCWPIYDNTLHNGIEISWIFDEGSEPKVTEDKTTVTHQYPQAGEYNVTMTFKSRQLPQSKKFTQKYVIWQTPVSYFTRGDKDGTANCSDSKWYQTSGKYSIYHNNFSLFNQDQFTIYNEYWTSGASCKCHGTGPGKGWGPSDNKNYWVSEAEAFKTFDCWGNLNQHVKTTICLKSDPSNCRVVSN